MIVDLSVVHFGRRIWFCVYLCVIAVDNVVYMFAELVVVGLGGTHGFV
jgi:hypothetical protein